MEAFMFDRQGNRKHLNSAERRVFLRTAKAEPDALRRAFTMTLFHCGCRISEALNVTAEHVDLANKAVVFETLKRRKRGHFRAVPIPDSLVVLLREVLPPDPSARV